MFGKKAGAEMATVDSLNIQISAQANRASASIDKIVGNLNTLSASLRSINASGLSGLSSGVQKLGKAVQTLNGVKISDFTRIAKGFEKFAKIDVSGLTKVSGGLNTLARSLSSLSEIQNIGNITPAINAIKNLARVDMTGFDTAKMQTISNSVSEFAKKLSSVKDIDSKVVRLVSAMAKLANSGQYISNVTTSFPTLGNQVVKLVKDLSGVGTVDANITKLVDGIARLASAGRRTKETTQHLKSLGDSIMNLLNRLRHAPTINANIANTIQGLGNLAASGSRISTVANNASTRTSHFGNALRTLKDRLTGANKSTKGLVSSIGMFYARMFLVIRVIKAFGKAIGSVQDYIEEFNYFSVALDKIGKDSASQFKKAGYNSAEEYAKSFRTRFAKLQTQMTGYEVDYDTGEATSKGIHNLGLDLTEVMNFNAAISQITNSAGMLGETSIMTSKALSMLSADWSSLSNQDLSDVMNNMQSALIGQSRAVYKYGIDITSAGLAQTALNHGIEVSIKDLSQQAKMQLRVLTMLEQSKVAYGDLARTINQPANQLRMLQAGFKNLSRSIGNLFLPVVQKIYPYLNAVVIVLQQFVQWVAKMAGINLKEISGVSLPDTEEPADGMEDYADATDKAAKKQKKLNDNLQGFDIINKLQKDESGKDDDDDKKNKNLDLSSDIAAALKGYEKIWDKAFKDNQNKAVQLAQRIKKALLDGWNKGGDFTELGKKLGTWINKGLEKIPWNNIKKTLNKIAKSIATFLNGLVDEIKWDKLGENIAEGLNTAIGAAYTFWTTFDWLKFGESLGTAVDSFIKEFDADKFGELLGAKLRGIIQFAYGAVTTFVENDTFSNLGEKIGNAINGFFEEMGAIDERTGLTGWQELGKTISDSIIGILDTVNTALSTVKWTEIGKSIGQFIGSINWGEIFVKTGLLVINALWSSIKVAVSALATDPLGVVSAITTILAGWFTVKKLASVTLALKTAFSGVLQTALMNATNALKTGGIKGLLQTKLGKIGAIAITLTIAVEGIKWANEKWSEIFDTYTTDEISQALDETFSGIFGENGFSNMLSDVFFNIGLAFSQDYGAQEWADAISKTFSDAVNGIKSAWNAVVDFFSGIWSGIKNVFYNVASWFTGKFTAAKNGITNAWNTMKGFFSDIWGKIKNVFGNVKGWFSEKFSGAKNAATTAWNGVSGFFSDVWNGVKEAFSGIEGWFEEKFSDAWDAVKVAWDGASGFFEGIWEGIKESAKTPLNGLLSFFETVANGVIDAFNGIKKMLNKLSIDIPGVPKVGFNFEMTRHVEIKKFATGGFPDKGQLFIANEAGPELVGNMNGKTAVAPQNDIAAGFAAAITRDLAPAMYSAFKQAATESARENGGDVYLDGTKLTENVIGHINRISRSRGRNPIYGMN